MSQSASFIIHLSVQILKHFIIHHPMHAKILKHFILNYLSIYTNLKALYPLSSICLLKSRNALSFIIHSYIQISKHIIHFLLLICINLKTLYSLSLFIYTEFKIFYFFYLSAYTNLKVI